MNFRQVGNALLVLLLVLSSTLLARALPNWLLALPAIAFAIALLMISRHRTAGYSVGLLGLFLMFLFGVAYVIGDAEEPSLSYVAMPRYGWLAVVCATFLAQAWILRRARTQ
jgi:uncharacterized membrane protein